MTIRKGKKAVTQTKRVKKSLTFILTDSEKLKYGEIAAAASSELRDTETEFTSVKKGYQEVIKEKKGIVSHHLNLVKSGKETRYVECDEVKDFERKTVSYVYQGEVMEERPMTADKMQVEFGVINGSVVDHKYDDERPENLTDIARHMRNETSAINN